jgi:hypothetical protein
MNEPADQKSPSDKEQTSNAVAKSKSENPNVPEEQTVSTPSPQSYPQYQKGRAYDCTYLATQIVIAVFASAGVIVAICSLDSLNRSVTSANQQAQAAAGQAQVAQQQYEASERPWVTISKTQADGLTDDHRMKMRFELINSGASPASHVFFKNQTFGTTDPLNMLAVAECKAKPVDAGVGILLVPNAPRAVQPIFSNEIDTDTVQYIREQLGQVPKPRRPVNHQPHALVFVGCIYYVWADRCYNTRFCEQYQPVSSPEFPNGYFSYCNFNNDTDEDEHCQIHK